ncbi:MAG: hypothetical protein SGI89_01265 [bacterium]|nr:hypothetical protein [bacterium]
MIEIETKRIIEKKRKILAQNIKEAQADIEIENYVTRGVEEIMKAVDEEVKSDKEI